jgi:hypothetical protein
MKSLVSAIVLQAVRDLEKDRFRSDAWEFFNSDWFETIAEVLELDPVSMKKTIQTGKIQN